MSTSAAIKISSGKQMTIFFIKIGSCARRQSTVISLYGQLLIILVAAIFCDMEGSLDFLWHRLGAAKCYDFGMYPDS